MGEFEKHLVDELVGADRAAYRRQFGVRWVAADEVVLVKALELVVADAAGEQGKGGKDRHAMLSPQLLELLRDWWRIARPQVWLFPGLDPINPMSTRQLNRACHAAAQMAEKLSVWSSRLRYSEPMILLYRSSNDLWRRLPPERSEATIDDAFERLHRAEFAGAARLKAPRPKVDANRVLVIRALLAALILIALFFAGVHARASLDELTSS
jgi:hypothetical protein